MKFTYKDKRLAPVRMTTSSSGYDVRASQDTVIPAKGVALVPTGVKHELNNDMDKAFPLFLFARSSMQKRGLIMANGVGVIDTDYRDEIMVPYYNISDVDVKIEKYERIGQLVPMKINNHMIDGATYTNLERTGGFGSTERTHV